jgi:hypothetical protein
MFGLSMPDLMFGAVGSPRESGLVTSFREHIEERFQVDAPGSGIRAPSPPSLRTGSAMRRDIPFGPSDPFIKTRGCVK